mmetsp:Transcript_27146/g.72024  ORF Transcript_27146/g.72024 Transcript_27146/m.72024 type:complete len:203 (+) Transcript_27146:1848-2456(+)
MRGSGVSPTRGTVTRPSSLTTAAPTVRRGPLARRRGVAPITQSAATPWRQRLPLHTTARTTCCIGPRVGLPASRNGAARTFSSAAQPSSTIHRSLPRLRRQRSLPAMRTLTIACSGSGIGRRLGVATKRRGVASTSKKGVVHWPLQQRQPPSKRTSRSTIAKRGPRSGRSCGPTRGRGGAATTEAAAATPPQRRPRRKRRPS